MFVLTTNNIKKLIKKIDKLMENLPEGQCSRYQVLTRGTSIALLVRPERILNGRGAHIKAIPLPVFSVYNGTSLKFGTTSSGNKKSSSSGNGSIF